MLYGQGIDLVFVPEFESALKDKSHFFAQYFTREEQEYCHAQKESARSFSARYAAKEAFLKALDGPRLNQGQAIVFDYREVELRTDLAGRPYLIFKGELKRYLRSLRIVRSSVSLSHTGDYSIAQVYLEIEA
ncbi:MAG: holo-ACP synthase [Leptospiraceae bacterium]|nr:holo-ACP synthase [Leptospiraceae bacterium]MCB1306024.1 holo-ACP synthase [Leptospiraceae bacterium]